MAEILMCSQPTQTDRLASQCDIPSDGFFGLNGVTSTLQPYQPYLLGHTPSDIDLCIMHSLGSPQAMQNLTNIALSVGPDHLHGIAEVHDKLQHHDSMHHAMHLVQDGVEKAATTVEKRMHHFSHNVHNYEKNILAYRDTLKSSSASHGERVQAKLRAKAAFDKMQQGFKNELRVTIARKLPTKGSPLTNFDRAANIAKSSRTAVKLQVTNQVEASKLAKLGKGAKVLGPGLVAFDMWTRSKNVVHSYKTGGKWERDMFVESSSFATSVITGDLIATAGVEALGLLVMATPVGWVGLIIGGIIVAGAATAGAIYANDLTKENAGGIYDSIMKKLGI